MTTPNARELTLAREMFEIVMLYGQIDADGVRDRFALALASYREEVLGEADSACKRAIDEWMRDGSDNGRFAAQAIVGVSESIRALSQPKGGTGE